MIHRVSASDPVDRMPPEGEPLSGEEIGVLRAWIAQGAQYERHWSLEPIERVEPPPAEGPWGERAIDAFVLARLREAELEPGPVADRRTLIRRLSLDITGLPPTPEEVEAFVRDVREDALERLVDRLLDSPAFGERWARHWLDLMRYAETYGHEFDYPIEHAYQYRDYVIRALNADVPYDDFVTEHIAGDLLENPRRHPEHGFNESILGTGFWWLSQGTHGPTDVRADEAERIDNQIDVLSKAFMATTVSCARCHDHKFDPITQKDYYGLSGYVQSSRRQQAYLDPDGRIAAVADELEALDREARAVAEVELRPELADAGKNLPKLLLASLEVLRGEPGAGEAPPADTTITFESFDGDSYQGWTVEGDAFTDKPSPNGDGFLEGHGTARGAGFANTHFRFPGENSVDADKRQGRLLSEPFTIERDYIHFLIGGGNHAGKTGLRLLVDNEVVREATGTNTIELHARHFDVADLRGQTARIELIDRVSGGWGNTRVDEIRLSDELYVDRPKRRSVSAVAAEFGVDGRVLDRWVLAVQAVDPGDRSHVLHVLLGAVEGDDLLAWVREGVRGREERLERTAPLAEFAHQDQWFATGWAFGQPGSQREPGAWHAPGRHARLTMAAGPDSSALAPELTGTLRSPTFEIERPWLLARARGQGRLRLIIDGYHLDEYNALLFDDVIQDIDSDDWVWRAHKLEAYVGHRAHYEMIDDRRDGGVAVSDLRWSNSADTPSDDAMVFQRLAGSVLQSPAQVAGAYGRALERVAGGGTDEFGIRLANWILGARLVERPARLESIHSEFAGVAAGSPTPMRALAMADGTGEDEYIFIRGDHRQEGETAPRGFLTVLGCEPISIGEAGSGRLDLARMLLDDSNPFPARVMANRVWHHLMGRGIVATTDDFGLLGKSPTHPELLDHLASRFRDDLDWSVKALIREIVLSRTYRLASAPLSERARTIDPDNLLWSVRTPKRLDGEALRDSILAVSGGLDPRMYGPPVPVHLTRFMTGRGRPGKSGPVDGDGRRSVYLEVRRNFLNPMMQTFDAPVPHSTMGKRNESNVPAQSLILLNAPFVTGQAEKLAERLQREGESAEARIELLYELALSRVPTGEERDAALAFVSEIVDGETDPWVQLCHVVFNLKEFSFIE
jgi:transposase-like protein